MTPRYRHTQIGWAIIGALLLPVALLAVVVAYTRTWVPLVSLLPLLIALPLFSSLTVQVNDEAVDLQFGLGPIRRRIALTDIASIAMVEQSWTSGWGVRIIPGGRLYSVSGTRAVELMLVDGRRIRIGTDDLDRLMAAIRGALATVTPSSLPPSRDFTILIPAIIVASVLVIAAGSFGMATRPIEVETLPDGIAISDGGYSARIPTTDIVRMHLDDRLPEITTRADGEGASGRLRGHFTLADGRAAELFVTREAPPFITIETGHDPVIFNFDDAGRTRDVYARLSAVP